MAKELEPEAKEAIRRYLIQTVAIPGGIVALLMGVAGFVIHDVAMKDAYHQAYREGMSTNLLLYTSSLDRITDRVVAAAETTAVTRDATRRQAAELTSLDEQASALREQLRTAEAFQSSESTVDEVVEALSVREAFLKRLTDVALAEASQYARKEELSAKADKAAVPLLSEWTSLCVISPQWNKCPNGFNHSGNFYACLPNGSTLGVDANGMSCGGPYNDRHLQLCCR